MPKASKSSKVIFCFPCCLVSLRTAPEMNSAHFSSSSCNPLLLCGGVKIMREGKCSITLWFNVFQLSCVARLLSSQVFLSYSPSRQVSQTCQRGVESKKCPSSMVLGKVFTKAFSPGQWPFYRECSEGHSQGLFSLPPCQSHEGISIVSGRISGNKVHKIIGSHWNETSKSFLLYSPLRLHQFVKFAI